MTTAAESRGNRTRSVTTASSAAAKSPEAYLCKLLDLDMIVIILRSSVKDVVNNTAVFQYKGQIQKGEILFRGSKAECQQQWEDILSSEQHDLDDYGDVDEADDEQLIVLESAQGRKNGRQQAGQKRPREEAEATPLMQKDVSNGSIRRTKRPRPTSMAVNDQENVTTNAADQNVSSDTGAPMAIDQIKELFTNLQKKHDESFKQLNRKLEMKLGAGKFDLSNYRDSTNVPIATTVIYNNINLTSFIARDPAHFARRVLRFLYTNDELSNSLLPDRPVETRKHYSKQPLDESRYEILHRALRAKYGVSGSKYDDFYEKCVRRSLIDLMQSCRKKERCSRTETQPTNEDPVDIAPSSPLLSLSFSPLLN